MINIFARKVTGKGQKLHMEQQSKVGQLVNQINRAFKYTQINSARPIEYVQLYFRGHRIDKDHQQYFDDLEISNNSIIHVVQKYKESQTHNQQPQKIHLNISIQNKLLNYQLEPHQSIEQFKNIICADLEIGEEDLTLSHLGSQLHSHQYIHQLNLSNHSLISANATRPITSNKFATAHQLSKEDSKSQTSQNVPKIDRNSDSPLSKKMRKAQSLNVAGTFSPQAKDKGLNFSMRLNKIDEKNDEDKYFNQSQISEEQSQVEQGQKVISLQSLTKPKQKTLQSLAKPFIETESIVGDQESEQTCSQCLLEVIRSDKKKQFVLQCRSQDTFEDALKVIAILEKTQTKNIKLMLGFEDISKSAISSRSSHAISKNSQSPSSSTKKKKRLSSQKIEMSLLSVKGRPVGISSVIIESAIKQKVKIISIEYEKSCEI